MSIIVNSNTSLLSDPFSEHLGGLWFLLRTRTRQEKVVANDLATRGVPHFLPLMRCMRYYGNRKAEVELPMFPGYVFLRGAANDAFATDRAGRLAQIIPVVNQERLTDELKNIALALGTNAQLSYYSYLQKGVRVEVRSGPFRGLRGMIEEWTKRNRLILQVEILGRGVCLELDAALLDVIE
jgi:transcription antitermination factor NusG